MRRSGSRVSRRSGVALALSVALSAGCASTRPRARVAVYWVTSPPFAYRSLGEVRATGRDERAHLDEVLDDVEAQAAALGADAIVIRDVRTDARWVAVSNMRTCSQVGIGGVPATLTCPGRTGALELETSLVAVAVERVGARSDPGSDPGSDPRAELDRRWPSPPPLQGEAPRWRERSATTPPWPDLDDTLPVR